MCLSSTMLRWPRQVISDRGSNSRSNSVTSAALRGTNRKSNTPATGRWGPRTASSPKSVSKVKMSRSSLTACRTCSRSDLPGAVSVAEYTSCPALRRARTVWSGMFSSASSRTKRRQGGPAEASDREARQLHKRTQRVEHRPSTVGSRPEAAPLTSPPRATRAQNPQPTGFP